MNTLERAVCQVWRDSQAARRGDPTALRALVMKANQLQVNRIIRDAAMACLTEWEGAGELLALPTAVVLPPCDTELPQCC